MKKNHRSNNWLKMIGVFVGLSFSLSTGAWSAPEANTSVNDVAQPVAKPKLEESSRMEVPSALATLEDSFVSTDNKKLVVYIQDIPASENAQDKITDLIQYYSRRYGMNFVAYEDNRDLIDNGKSFQFSDQKLRQAVPATSLQLWDAEDAGTYQKSMKLFQNALRVRQEATSILDEYESALTQGFEKTAFDRESSKQRITKAVDRLHILKAMVNLTATSEEVDQYWANDFKFSEICFLSCVRSIDGQKQWEPSRQNQLDDLIQSANDFYAFARKKGRVLASNLVESLKKQQSAIFVGGGFHAPGITQRLKKEGVSYVLLSPKDTGTQKA